MKTKHKLFSLSKKLFFILIFLIPFNLGKHYCLEDSYVSGLVVDYLVPTVFVQDMLVLFILVLWITGGGFSRLFLEPDKVLNKKHVLFSALFIFSLLLSSITSLRFIPSVYYWLRIFSLFLLYLYILMEIPIEEYFFNILNAVSLSVFFLSILAVAQFISGGSVFDNYLILGEQPYNSSMYGVVRENFFGRAIVPSYGLFRHPNVFGGYLSLMLVWIFSFSGKKIFYRISFILGFFALLTTFSYISWAVFLFGILCHLFLVNNPTLIKKKKKILVTLVVVISSLILLSPVLETNMFDEKPSFFRRTQSFKTAYRMIRDYPMFGVGINNFTVLVDKYNYDSPDIRFTQPVHNIFLLIFSEAGIFAILFFLAFLFTSGKKLLNSSYFHLFLISFLQIILLGSFDHYLFTANQTQLVFWIILGLALQ